LVQNILQELRLGNVGYNAAKFRKEGGCQIIGVTEYEGALHHPWRLDVDAITANRREKKSVLNFPGVENIPNSKMVLERECDILIPAALENQITEDNGPRVQAKIVAEAANGSVTAQAEGILLDKSVPIVPDVDLNAGGVTVSYFEWLKNLSHVSLGRMEKRFEQSAFGRMMHTVCRRMRRGSARVGRNRSR